MTGFSTDTDDYHIPRDAVKPSAALLDQSLGPCGAVAIGDARTSDGSVIWEAPLSCTAGVPIHTTVSGIPGEDSEQPGQVARL